MSGQLRLLQRGTHAWKALFFDGSGLWLCAKRLSKGRFDWPEDIEGVAKVAISAIEFAALMDGLELTQTRAKLVAQESGANRKLVVLCSCYCYARY